MGVGRAKNQKFLGCFGFFNSVIGVIFYKASWVILFYQEFRFQAENNMF